MRKGGGRWAWNILLIIHDFGSPRSHHAIPFLRRRKRKDLIIQFLSLARSPVEHSVLGQFPVGGGNLQCRRGLSRRILGVVAFRAELGRIRRQDQAVLATINPGILPRVGEGHVRETGEECNVPNARAGVGSVSQQARGVGRKPKEREEGRHTARRGRCGARRRIWAG